MLFSQPPTQIGKGRMLYTFSTVAFEWFIDSNWTAKLALKPAGLYVGGTLVSASDKRLKWNDKPLTNAFDIMNKLEPV